jgi:hypothetical protein
MDFINRLLKSSIKSCISKYVQNDINLDQMVFQQGIFELNNIQLNCNEINKQLHDNVGVPFFCENVKIGSMKIHPSWGNFIQKIEFNDAFIKLTNEHIEQSFNLSKTTMHPQSTSASSSATSGSSNQQADSIFFYSESNNTDSTDNNSFKKMQDSLSGSIASALNKDFTGYQGILNNVEKITKEFVGCFNNVIIEYKSLRLHVGNIIYDQKLNQINIDIKNVNVVVQGNSVLWLEHLKCDIESSDSKKTTINICVPDNVKSNLIIKFDIVWLLIKYFSELFKSSGGSSTKEKKVFSNKSDSDINSSNIDIRIPHLCIELEKHSVKLEDISIQKTNDVFNVKVKEIDSSFLKSSAFALKIITNDLNESSTLQNNILSSPFEDQVCYYGDGGEKPKSLASQCDQDSYKENQRHQSSKHIICIAKKAWIEWKTFFGIIKSVFSRNSDDTPPVESNTPSAKKWLEIQVDDATVVYKTENNSNSLLTNDEIFTFGGTGINVYLGEHYWNIDAKTVSWIPRFKSTNTLDSHQSARIIQFNDVHCAANRNMELFVVNADKCLVLNVPELHRQIKPFLETPGKPLSCQINLKIKHILCKQLLSLNTSMGNNSSTSTSTNTTGLTNYLSFIGQGLEVFNTFNAMNVILQKGVVKLNENGGDSKIIGVSMAHINHYQNNGKV